jgi:hypothetical protein
VERIDGRALSSHRGIVASTVCNVKPRPRLFQPGAPAAWAASVSGERPRPRVRLPPPRRRLRPAELTDEASVTTREGACAPPLDSERRLRCGDNRPGCPFARGTERRNAKAFRYVVIGPTVRVAREWSWPAAISGPPVDPGPPVTVDGPLTIAETFVRHGC